MIEQKKYNPIKLRLSKFLLKNNADIATRKVKACSIENAKKIGVAFVVKNPQELEQVKKILKELNSLGKNTIGLGYIPEKKPNDFYLSEKTCSFFCDKELDWLLRPNTIGASEFQNYEFDILIDLGSYSYHPMKYVIDNSRASFKIGWLIENGPFDLMMDIDYKKGIEYYFSQIMHYLTILK